jgi:hypothetical protein
MLFFPHQSEILVSPQSKAAVMSNLEKVTKNMNFLAYDALKENKYLFNGKIQEDSFTISQVIDRADSFVPLIKGKIEDTPMGSILFLSYSLFPSSAFFLGFWTVVSLLLCLFFGITSEKYVYSALSLGSAIVNYGFAWAHFRRKIKLSRAVFHEIMEMKKTE